MNSGSTLLDAAIRRAIRAMAVASGAAVMATPALADTAAPQLEEIVITTQKREQSLKEVPITVSVVDADAIRESGATMFDDLISRIPGVSGFTTGIATSVWTIRGLSSNTSGSGGEPSVGFYQDEAFASYIEFAAMPLFDTNRIEVAKGPQGTLFGKNAAAGAILVYTNRPDPDAGLSGYGQAGFGNLGQQRVEAAINVPLGERFAVRASGMYEKMDDWQRNQLVAGSEGGGMERRAGRLGLTWNITDSLDAHAFVHKFEGESNMWLTTNQRLTGDRNPDNVFSVLAESSDLIETQGAHLSLNWRVSDRLTLKSLTDFREMPEYLWQADAVAARPATILAATTAGFGLPISSVLAVQGPLGGEGSNFASEMLQQEFRGAWQGDNLFLQGGVNYVEYSETRPMQAAVLNLDTAGFRLLQSTGWLSERKSYGVFLDGTWNFSTDLTLTAGVRYSKDELDFRALADAFRYLLPAPAAFGTYPAEFYEYTAARPRTAFCAFSLTSPAAPCLGAGLSADRSDTGVTPRLAVTYRLTDSTNLYANYARGYKAGGFDVVAVRSTPTSAPSINGYEPETVDAFDVGLKGQTAGLRYSASVFLNKYRDLQLSAIVNAVSRTENAASAHGRGFEGEVTWAPNAMWEISGNYTYLDAKYDSGQIALGNQPVAAKGLRLVRSPEQMANLQVTMTVPLGGFGTLRVAPLVHYQSAMELNPANRADLRQGSYTRLDARVSLVAQSGKWDLALVGENLTGVDDIVNRAADLVGLGPQYAYLPGEPLYRLEVGFRVGND
jgi:iron complex outermembrane receptor protein